MAKTTEITVGQWLKVRAEVAKVVTANSTVRSPTHERIAEALLTSGYIDVEYVLSQITEREKPEPVVSPKTATAAIEIKKPAVAMKETAANGR